MRLSGKVRFCAAPDEVWRYFERGVLDHAVEPAQVLGNGATEVLTRYETRRWYGTVMTTERAQLEPGVSVTWTHVDGPLTGSQETFSVEPAGNGHARVRYVATVRARHPLFRGPLTYLFVGPELRKVSMASIRDARRTLDGE